MINPFDTYAVLTFFLVDRPVNEVVEGFWFDATARERSYPDFPKEMLAALTRLKESGPAVLSYLRKRSVTFDLRWTYHDRLTRYDPRDHPRNAMFWAPANAPDQTCIIAESLDGYPTLLGPSADVRDWRIFWTYIDDRDKGDGTVCRFQYCCDFEKIRRSVWAGLDTDDERKPRWRFDKGGPMRAFEKPNNYSAHRIQDRLTRESIADYCLRLGCDIRSDDFWRSNEPAWVIWHDMHGTYPDPPFRQE